MSEEENFTKKVGGIIAHGMVTLGVSLGTKLGLFEGLSKLAQSIESAVTSQQLADSLNMKERYVREWIRSMACTDLVDHVEKNGEDRYWLEPYRLKALLGDKLKWQACYAELVTTCCSKLNLVERCFPIDGPRGTDVDDYPEIHEWLAKRNVCWKYPENVNKVIDDEELRARLDRGIDVLEMGCGAAEPSKLLSKQYPNSRYVASELSEMNLAKAKENCKGLDNVSYAVVDACQVPKEMEGKFDLVMMFDVYHDVPYPDKLLAGVKRLLRPGGQLFMNEIDAHESVSENKKNGAAAGMYYSLSTAYCLPTSFKHPGGAGLGACAGKELVERELKKEFAEVKQVAKDIGLFFLCSKSL